LKTSTNNKAKNGQVLDICVKDFLNLPVSVQKNLKGYRVPVVFNTRPVPFDPYMIGYWLGDGCSRASLISSQDSPVLHYFSRNLIKYDLYLSYSSQYDYRICGNMRPNTFYKTLKDLNLLQNKHIPDVYKINSRSVQLEVLAGLIDSDGSLVSGGGGWDIIQKNERLLDDIIFMCRSLGFACYKKKCIKVCTNAPGGPKGGVYYRCCITGSGVEQVPCKVVRKRIWDARRQSKNVLVSGISIEKLEVGEYFGFEIDGNRRFLLGDFTVTHNTVCALALAARLGRRTLIIVHKLSLIHI
jgi:replicative DNA helicase